jgi:hypothetical protein
MARGAYRESTALNALRQLVEFSESDDEGDPIALAELGRSLVALQASNAQVAKVLKALTTEQLRSVKQDLRAFLRAAGGPRGGADYLQATMIRVELLPLLGTLKATKGRERWLFGVAGAPRDVLLYQVAMLLATVGEDRLQFCPAPDCGRSFVKVGRREYCSDRCQRRVFVSTYDPFKAQPRRKDRHGKTTRKK